MRDDLHHGGALDVMAQRFPDAPPPWIDLSTGINPWPWRIPTNLLTSSHLLQQLPTQSDWQQCRAAMAATFGASEETVLPVPGTAMAIALMPHLLDAKRATVLAPSYSDHAKAWANINLEETPDPLEAASESDVVALCNPNNPDGRIFPKAQLLVARDTLARHDGTLIVDEAYGELTPSLSVASESANGNLIVLRSFGKFYGLAGIRLGAIIAAPHLLERLSKLLGDWTVSTLALQIGMHAYCDHAYADSTRTGLKKARISLDAVLETARLTVIGGTDLFRFIQTPSAHSLWTHLAERGIYIRRFAWSDTRLRIGLPPTPGAQERLVSALASWGRP